MALRQSKGRAVTVDRGEFFCPECRVPRGYRKQKVQRGFTLYDVPLLPIAKFAYHIECDECRGTFRTGVLAYGGLEDTHDVVAEFHRVILHTIVLMMVADSEIEAAEIDAVIDIYRSITGVEPPRSLVRREIVAALEPPRDPVEYLAMVAPYLNEHGRRLVLRAAAIMAQADGALAPEENRLIGRIAGALDVSPDELREILDGLRGESAP
jgi:uncharacterized tellurite resistance protein B-like protein